MTGRISIKQAFFEVFLCMRQYYKKAEDQQDEGALRQSEEHVKHSKDTLIDLTEQKQIKYGSPHSKPSGFIKEHQFFLGHGRTSTRERCPAWGNTDKRDGRPSGVVFAFSCYLCSPMGRPMCYLCKGWCGINKGDLETCLVSVSIHLNITQSC